MENWRNEKLKKLYYSKKLLKYIEQYAENYTIEDLGFLYNQFLRKEPSEEKVDILTQVYDAFDLLPPEKNRYLQFAQLVGDLYGWNSHILEVGGGFFPAFSKHMDILQQKNHGSGTITTYDPNLVMSKLGRVRLHKENFQEEMTIESYNVIVGILPCRATSLIIKKAIQEHKEFFIAMCGCIHLEGLQVPMGLFGPYINYDGYVEQIYGLAKEQEKDGFEVIKEKAKAYQFPFPVIRSKKIK